MLVHHRSLRRTLTRDSPPPSPEPVSAYFQHWYRLAGPSIIHSSSIGSMETTPDYTRLLDRQSPPVKDYWIAQAVHQYRANFNLHPTNQHCARVPSDLAVATRLNRPTMDTSRFCWGGDCRVSDSVQVARLIALIWRNTRRTSSVGDSKAVRNVSTQVYCFTFIALHFMLTKAPASHDCFH